MGFSLKISVLGQGFVNLPLFLPFNLYCIERLPSILANCHYSKTRKQQINDSSFNFQVPPTFKYVLLVSLKWQHLEDCKNKFLHRRARWLEFQFLWANFGFSHHWTGKCSSVDLERGSIMSICCLWRKRNVCCFEDKKWGLIMLKLL